MRFVVLIDYTDMAGRERSLPAHKEYLAKGRADGAVVESGAFADAKGGMYILELPDLAAAEAFVAADPYKTDGKLSLTIRQWQSIVGVRR
ncbi:MAG: hypothetical protein JO347_08935 [Candidatus Eremiobacteraeota bacterium]|nr:hypothetical protein [Candidatus Eremiobacteraeota bacterium]MBV8282172.1 hypothetical protein [Candidatus Eremiobacteraeota bacterium]